MILLVVRGALARSGSPSDEDDLTRLAYVATDGTPRCVPIAFTWNGSEIVLCTTKNAPELPALRKNPMIALTIDTEVHPPRILLIRGRAELYTEASHAATSAPERDHLTREAARGRQFADLRVQVECPPADTQAEGTGWTRVADDLRQGL